MVVLLGFLAWFWPPILSLLLRQGKIRLLCGKVDGTDGLAGVVSIMVGCLGGDTRVRKRCWVQDPSLKTKAVEEHDGVLVWLEPTSLVIVGSGLANVPTMTLMRYARVY
jgi:hypothetical protein